MAKTPINSVLGNWNKRLAQAHAAGLDINKIKPIAEMDIQRVSRGGQAYTDQEAVLASLAAVRGAPPIPDPKKKTGLKDILGNAGTDIGGIVKGFIPGVIHDVTHIGKLPGAVGHGLGEIGSGHIAQGIQDVAKAPGLGTLLMVGDAIPGVDLVAAPLTAGIYGADVASKLTTKQGREELAQHPVGAALELLPAVSKGMKLATAGADAAEAGSVAESVQAGKPVQAIGRLTHLSDVKESIAKSIGVDQVTAKFLTNYSTATRQLRTQVAEFVNKSVKPVLAGLDQKTLETLGAAAEDYHPYAQIVPDPVQNAQLHAVLQNVRSVNDLLAQVSEGKGTMMIPDNTGKMRVYSIDHPVARQVRKIDALEQRLTKVTDPIKSALYQKKIIEERKALVKKINDKPPEAFQPKVMERVRGRATQAVQDAYTVKEDPSLVTLYHGTTEQAASAIQTDGFMGRDVWLHPDRTAAEDYASTRVAQRPGEGGPKVLSVKVPRQVLDSYRAQNMENGIDLGEVHNIPASVVNEFWNKQSNPSEYLGHIRAEAMANGMEANLRHIQEAASWQDFQKIVGDKEFKSMLTDSMKEWTSMAAAGFDPIWMHHVSEDRINTILNPRPLPDTYTTPTQWRQRTFNFSPYTKNLAVGLTHAGVELLRTDSTRMFVDQVLLPLTRGIDDVRVELRDSLRSKYSSPEALNSAVETAINDKFRPIDPANPFSTERISITHDNARLLDKSLAKNIDRMMGWQQQLPVHGLWDRSLGVFKFSVLTGPRHIVHVALGGLAFGMLREPGMLLKLNKAISIVKNREMPQDMAQGNWDLPTNDIVNLSASKTMARHYVEAVGNKVEAIKRFEDFVSNVQRTSVLLSAESRGLSHEAALNIVSKTFIDMDKMAPFERYIIKQVFPFYAFTKHIFRYLLSYPVDHPIRAAVLSKFAEQEQAEWKTGLPLKYQQLMFIGHGDNPTAVDVKSINPFRSFANDFSLTGFIQSLNPIAGAVEQSLGVNPVTAVPELYPQVSYDPVSGTLQAKRSSFLGGLVSSYIPETQAIQALIGKSDQMRNLRQTNPDAYRRAIFSYLNIPFAFGKVSVPQIKGKAEIARYQAAQKAVSNAISKGNWSETKRFNVVPYQGQFVKPAKLEALWKLLQNELAKSGQGSVSPKAVLTTKQLKAYAKEIAR